jgi:hypothetical protein
MFSIYVLNFFWRLGPPAAGTKKPALNFNAGLIDLSSLEWLAANYVVALGLTATNSAGTGLLFLSTSPGLICLVSVNDFTSM